MRRPPQAARPMTVDQATGPHTEADLERLRMALAEVAPETVLWLEDGWIHNRPSSRVGDTLVQAYLVARVPLVCTACDDLNRPDLDERCEAIGPPPYVDDCGRDRS